MSLCLIKNNLSIHNVVLLNNLCVLCGVEEESINHLFFNCKLLGLFGECVIIDWRCRPLIVMMRNHIL